MAETNAVTRAPINAGGKLAAIVPHNFDDAWRIATALANSGMTPKDINTPEKCLAIIMAGAEIGMPPFQALQSFAIINGRPTIWGDGMMAVARAGGAKVSEWSTGTLDAGDFTAFCKVTRADTSESIERSFSMDDAKRAKLWGKRGASGQDTPWITYPARMIQMRARAWALRDGCADILRGIKMAEEVQDIPPEDVRVIDNGDGMDQRPPEERQQVVIGAPARATYDELAQAMTDAKDLDALEVVFSQAERANLSANKTFGLSTHYENCRAALEEGREPPQAAKFADRPAKPAKAKAEAKEPADG